MPSVVLFGATGFLGPPIGKAIKKAHPDWSVTAYVRSTKPADELKATIGADRIVTGDFEDFERIKALSKEHDIAINAGSSKGPEPVNAIIAGLKERPSSSKGKLIHISGTGNFIDGGKSGNFNPDSKVWNDDKEEDIKQIHKDMVNGQSDTLVLEAGAEGALETYIVCPAVVYGRASVASTSVGVGYTLIAGNAKALGYAPYIGDGTALVSTIHVSDVVSFTMKIIELAAKGPAEGSAYSRFYAIETASFSWKEVATELAKVLHEKGVVASAEPKKVPLEEAGGIGILIGSNMLFKGDRAARMGYKAQAPTILEEMHKDLKDATL